MKRINRYFTAESVSPAHPDKTMDYIADTIVDAILKDDPQARIAIDGVCKNEIVTLGGEITTIAKPQYSQLIRQCLLDLGHDGLVDKVIPVLHLFGQSPDIALGTNDDVMGAGDQGTITGYACSGNDMMVPLEKALADSIMRELFLTTRPQNEFMKSDMKSQVTLYYDEEGVPHLHTIVVACQHTEGVDKELLFNTIKDSIADVLYNFGIPGNDYELIVNGTGEFTIGGPEADAGEVGRKIVVDSYGVSVPVGGGAFSGKDPSKVDRSAAYYARYVAKNIVSAGLADECLITLSYCIGLSKPISVDYEFFGTEKYDREDILTVLDEVTSYEPRNIIDILQLRRPIYAVSGLFGHFGTKQKLGLDSKTLVTVPWEQTNMVEELTRLIHDITIEEE